MFEVGPGADLLVCGLGGGTVWIGTSRIEMYLMEACDCLVLPC